MRRREAQKNIPAKKVSPLASFVAGLLISITLLSPFSININISQESAVTVAVSYQSALALEHSTPDENIPPPVAQGDKSKNPFYEGFCNATSPSTWFQGCLIAGFYEIIYTPSALLLAGGGWIFDIMLAFSLSKNVLDAGFAKNGWAVTRDLANMLFIFILLAIAIATILQISSYGAKSLLARLVIIALLLNFSLFITRVVVDVSNVTARLFYDSISPANTAANVPDGTTPLSASSYIKSLDIPTKDISVGLVAAFNPQQLLGIESFNKWVSGGKGLGELFFIYIFATVLNVITAWVLVSIAMLLITRVAVIWFLMAVAPLAFIAMILPNTKSWASRWWSELFSKSFSIAVFLFFLWIIAAFTSSTFLKDTFNTSASSAAGGLLQFVVIVGLQFSVLIVMLLMAKKVMEKMAGSIGGMSLAIGNKLAGGALGLLAGGVGGRLARGFIGRGGAMMAGSEGLQRAAQKDGATGWAARRMLLAGDAVSKKSFDIRNVPAVQKAMGSIDAGLGGGGGKGGYTAILAAQVKRKKEIGEFLAGSDSDGMMKKMRIESYAKRLETKGDSALSTLRRSVGLTPARKDREAALVLRKKKDILGDLKAELKKELEAEGKPKGAPSKSDEGKKGAEEIKGRLAI